MSVKSLKVLDKKLQWLAAHADFDVNINTVVGNGIGQPDDALTIAHRAKALGFGTSVGVIHDSGGQSCRSIRRASACTRRSPASVAKSTRTRTTTCSRRT